MSTSKASKSLFCPQFVIHLHNTLTLRQYSTYAFINFIFVEETSAMRLYITTSHTSIILLYTITV